MLKFYLILLSACSLFPRELIIAITPQLQEQINFLWLPIELAVGFFTFGSGIAQLLCVGIGDIVNKKKLLLIGAAIMLIGNILYYISINSFIFLATRFITGFGSGIFTVLIRVIIIQNYQAYESLKLLSWISMSTMIFPLIAPTLGIYVLYYFGINWDYNLSIIVAIGMLYCSHKMLFFASTEKIYTDKNIFILYYNNINEVIFDKKSLIPMCLSGLFFGCGVGYLTISTFLLQHNYGVPLTELGWHFICVATGYFFGSFASSYFHNSHNVKKYKITLFFLFYVSNIFLGFLNKNIALFDVSIFIYFFICGIYTPFLSQKSITNLNNPSAKSSILGFIRTFFSFVYAILASTTCSSVFSWLIMILFTVIVIQILLYKNQEWI